MCRPSSIKKRSFTTTYANNGEKRILQQTAPARILLLQTSCSCFRGTMDIQPTQNLQEIRCRLLHHGREYARRRSLIASPLSANSPRLFHHPTFPVKFTTTFCVVSQMTPRKYIQTDMSTFVWSRLTRTMAQCTALSYRCQEMIQLTIRYESERPTPSFRGLTDPFISVHRNCRLLLKGNYGFANIYTSSVTTCRKCRTDTIFFVFARFVLSKPSHER